MLYDQALDQLECCYGQNCALLAEANKSGCVIALQEAPSNLRELFNGHTSGGYIPQNGELSIETMNSHSRMMIPLRKTHTKPLGLLIFEFNRKEHFHRNDIATAQAVAELCVLALQKSQELASSDRMIKKLKLLSDASDVLLSEFDNVTLQAKLDFIVEKTLEILDAELCSLWLVKGESIVLETSYSDEGKVADFPVKSLLITNDPQSGLTGYMAYQKRVFNLYGEELQKLRAQAKQIPVDFLKSQETYSELAYPMLDKDRNLIGLFFAYNKKGEDGKPLKNSGFTKDFDEPLMKILTSKIVISIKNARTLKKLRDCELIVESTPDPVVICSEKGFLTYMNPGAINLFGDLRGCHVADFFPSDENSTGLEKARDIKRRVLRSPDKRLRNFETPFKSKSGDVLPLSLSVSLLRDEHGKEAGTIGIAKDLSETKALLATGQSLLQTQDIDAILYQIVQCSMRLPNCKRAYIKLYDEKSDRLVFRALISKNPEDEQLLYQSTPKHQGMTGYVFKTQRPHLSNDVFAEPNDRYFPFFANVKSKIVVPITYLDKETGGKRELGVISVDSEEPNSFSMNDQYFLETLGNQAAVALQNANLMAAKNKIITQLQAFERVQQATTGKNLDVDKIFEAILSAVVDVLGFTYATISEVDKERQMIGTTKGRNVPEEFLKLAWHSLGSGDIQAWVVRHKDTAYLTGWDERLDRGIFEKFNHQRLVRTIIPIIARGEVLGTLEAGYDKADNDQIEKDEIETLQRIVNLAGIGIEQAHLLRRLKNELALTNELEKQLDALNQASIRILNSTTENEAINHIFRSLESIGYTKGMLSLVNDVSKKIEGKYALGDNWESILAESKYDLSGNNIRAQSLRLKSPILVKNCLKDPRCEKRLVSKAKIRSQYVFPLIVKDKPVGTLQIDLSDWPALVQGDETQLQRRMKVLETFASQSAIAIRNIKDVLTIHHLEANIAETAHEFRSPLHNIMTQLGGLKDYLEQENSEKEIDQFVNVIEEEIYRAKRQVDNSLLLSERTQATMDFDFKEGYLQDVIKNCVDAYRLRALERGLSMIVKDGVKHLPKIVFDKDKMEQAVTNLIDNAVKYSHLNQYIEINGFDDGTQVNVEVSDRGVGIPPQDFETVFRGFIRAGTKDKMRYIPGTGLGLKICKEIIEKHGGEIKVMSVPLSHNQKMIKEFQDYRTTFRITLPKYRREKIYD
jgi:PAS domain S-box-containing protein